MVATGAIVDRRASGTNAGASNNELGFAARPEGQGMIDVASTRAAQEVQAAMVVAKKFPRDETAAYGRIMQACKRRSLAERAVYAYPRGGETVSGPSIRLAEVLAQNWGNIDFGIVELEQKYGESTMMSYAWDLETNTRQTKIFTIKHERHTRQGVKKLTDPRDMYELVANQGARRLRACILGVIPGDVVEAAMVECDKTIEGSNKAPLPDRIRQMVAAFAEIGVTQAMIEARLKHKVDASSSAEVLNLGKVYNAIRDGHGTIESFFEEKPEEPSDKPKGKSLAEQIAPKPQPQNPTPKPQADEPGASDEAARPSPAAAPEPQAAQPDAAQADADEPPADYIPDELIGTLATWRGAMKQHAEAVDMADSDFLALMKGVTVHSKVNDPRSTTAMAARREVLAAFRAGKLGADGKIQQQ